MPTITSGGGTLSIYPTLASSPANDAAMTFLSVDMSGGTKCRFASFNFDGTERVAMVDGSNYPVSWNSSEGLTVLDGSTDILGAASVRSFKNHMFFGNGSNLVFSAPFAQNDYTAANGAGILRLPFDITGLIVFREKMIIFTQSSIHQLSGNTAADFAMSDISDDLGCSEPDTIQEVGGDIMFMGPDGLRLLGATARIGDFSLGLASRQIQDELTDLTSLVIRGKSQYRIVGYTAGTLDSVTDGFIGTQFTDQEAAGFSWGKTTGIKAYRATSIITGSTEVTQFSGETGYYDPEGNVTGTLTFKYDFQRPDVIQPLSGGGSFTILGSAIFGTSAYGGNPETVIETQATGSFFTVSLQYEFATAGEPPFVIDTVLLEYANNDRK